MTSSGESQKQALLYTIWSERRRRNRPKGAEKGRRGSWDTHAGLTRCSGGLVGWWLVGRRAGLLLLLLEVLLLFGEKTREPLASRRARPARREPLAALSPVASQRAGGS